MNNGERIANIKLACKTGDLETIIRMRHLGYSMELSGANRPYHSDHKDELLIISARYGHLLILRYLCNHMSKSRQSIKFVDNGHKLVLTDVVAHNVLRTSYTIIGQSLFG